MSTGNRAGSPKRDAGTDRDRMFPRLTPEQMDRLASHGRTRAFSAGEVLTARAEEESASNRLAFYRVAVRRQDGVVVALFRGTVYRTNQEYALTNNE